LTERQSAAAAEMGDTTSAASISLKPGFTAPRTEMTDLTLEDIQAALRPLHSGLAELTSRMDGLASQVDGLASEMANVRIRVDGLPLLGVAVETLRTDLRLTRAAINDISRVNITSGEVEAIHVDINRTMARQDAIETRLATLERRAEHQKNGE
jgi:hypothetical protein